MRLNSWMGKRYTVLVGMLGAAMGATCLAAHALDGRTIVQDAVAAEMAANRSDHTQWRYLESEANGDKLLVIETRDGDVHRHVLERGKAPSAETLRADDAANQKFIHDPALRAKQRRDGANDDKSATELLNQMPVAFLWNVDSETPESFVLSYKPNPEFSPPDMQSRVMGAMTGSLVVSKPAHRIQTFKGRLIEDVTIGFGFLARIRQGSTFDVERRQVGLGQWQITETHVHIGGHALFFKTIGEQQDEIKSEFVVVPPETTLEQADAMLRAGGSSGPACCSAK